MKQFIKTIVSYPLLVLAITTQWYWCRVRRIRRMFSPLGRKGYQELKRAGQFALQTEVIDYVLSNNHYGHLSIIDLGDVSGRHVEYVKRDRRVTSLSVNCLQPVVDSLVARGYPAERADVETYKYPRYDVAFLFEILDHFENPIRAIRNVNAKQICLSVSYRKESRVALYHVRGNKPYPGVDREHVFELCPDDWKLVFQYLGWVVVYDKIYYQYPVWVPFARVWWKRTDFEGFWGAVLERRAK